MRIPRVAVARPALALALGSATLVVGAIGCSGSDEEERERPPATSAPPTTTTSAEGAEGTHETREADPRLPPAQLGLLEGNVTVDATTAVSGGAIEVGDVIGLEGPGRATLDLPGGARGTLWAPGAMLLAEAPDRGLWIVRGVVHVADRKSVV
jgi:hypothetical protein